MKSLGGILRGPIRNACVVGLAAVGLVGCSPNSGNFQREAYSEWINGGPKISQMNREAGASEDYKFEKNSFVVSGDVELSYSSNVKRDKFTLMMPIKKNPISGKQNRLEYKLGESEPVWCLERENGELKKYPLTTFINSVAESHFFGEIEGVRNYFEKSGLVEVGDGFRDEIGELNNLARDYLEDKNISEEERDNLVGNFRDIVGKYGEPLVSGLNYLRENPFGLPENYEIGGIPLDDLILLGADLYNILNIEIDEKSLRGFARVDVDSKSSASIFSEKVFDSRKDEDKKIVFRRGIASNVYGKVFAEAGIGVNINKEGFYVRDIFGFKDNFSDEVSELEEILLREGVLEKGIDGVLGLDEKILDLRLPTFSGEMHYKYLFDLGYRLEENDVFSFPINESPFGFHLGFLKATGYSKSDKTDTTGFIKSDLENSEVSFDYIRRKEEKVIDSRTPYLGVSGIADNFFGRMYLGLEHEKSVRTFRNFESKNRFFSNILESEYEGSELEIFRRDIDNRNKFLGDALFGVDLPFFKLGELSLYSSIESDGKFRAGVLGESKFLDFRFSEDGISGFFSLYGNGEFSRMYKESMTSDPEFVMDNVSQNESIRNNVFLDSEGIFLTGNSDRDFEKSEFGVLFSKSDLGFLHLRRSLEEIPRYSLGFGTGPVMLDLSYGVGEVGGKKKEKFGGSLGFSSGLFDLSVKISENETLSEEPFHKRKPRAEIEASVNLDLKF
jgi:hypothetical protein